MSLRLLGALASALLGWACYWSIRLAYADHLANGSRPAVERAIRLAPGNPGYYVRLAEADPSSAINAMQKAVELNPLNSSLWIESARVAEDQKDFQRAESSLLRAVQLDRTFAPRWLLAEYYFRRQDASRFWPAVRAAFAASYDDVEPLFDECWQLAPNPETILQQAIPDRQDVLRQYLDYLLAKKRLDLAEPVASKVMGHAEPADVPPLLSYCDGLLEGDTGLSWRVLDVLDGANLLKETGQLTGKERVEGEEQFSFTTPAETQLARLVLMYQRALGTVRITGSVSLRNVKL